MSKLVLLVQPSAQQALLWQAALGSQGYTANTVEGDVIKVLESLQQSDAALPVALLIESNLTDAQTNSLVAGLVCRWCRTHSPDTKVFLTNTERDTIRTLETRWAERQGAAGLFPKLSVKNAGELMQNLTAQLGSPLAIDRLTRAMAAAAAESTDTSSASDGGHREERTSELVRKMAMIPTLVQMEDPKESLLKTGQYNTLGNLSLDSTLKDLELFDCQMDMETPGKVALKAFEENPALPGIVLMENGQYVTLLSRRRFSEHMNRRYALDLFSRRPVRVFFEYVGSEALCLYADVPVVDASQLCLKRSMEYMYDPVVVQLPQAGQYRVLDVQHLFYAQSEIHKLTTAVLKEQTQAHMIQTEKMASLGQMVTEIAHDIKNPVNFIHGNLDYLTDYTNTLIQLLKTYENRLNLTDGEFVRTARQQADVDFVIQDLKKVIGSIGVGSEQLRKIVSGLQTFAYRDSEKPVAVNIRECLENSLTILNNRLLSSKIDVTLRLRELPTIEGFTGQVVQVFTNLISNAIDALAGIGVEGSAGDRLKLWQPKLEIFAEPKREKRLDSLEEWVEIRIADNGPGISPDIQEKIFDSFFTTKGVGKGTGLGLAICYQIVTQRHKGRLLLKSPREGFTYYNGKPGGTELAIQFPLSLSRGLKPMTPTGKELKAVR
jgi:signal transduction histidine kinase